MTYVNLAVTYDTSKWEKSSSSQRPGPTGGSFENALYSLDFPSCNIQEQAATEIGSPNSPPLEPYKIELEKIIYTVYRFDQPNKKLNVAWYIDEGSLNGYSYPDGIPIFIISATVDQWKDCETESQKVLEMLHLLK